MLDRIVIGGWIAIAVLGQVILRVEAKWLELAGALWLWAGVLLVRRAECLPLLLLSCPVFMCEDQRAWAWVQPAAAWLLFGRVLIESRFTFRQYAAVILCFLAVAAWSWPANYAALVDELRGFTRAQLFEQWLAPRASWAIFPFRQAVDRSMIAGLCAALCAGGRYVSSHRIWRAFRWVTLLALIAAFSAALVPWQAPHTFLGTTNYPSYDVHPFHGAGVNLSFFAMLLAVGMPWLFLVPHGRRGFIFIGFAGLLAPVIVVEQRALQFSVTAYVLVGLAMLLAAVLPGEARRKFIRRIKESSRHAAVSILALVLGLCVSACWFVHAFSEDHDDLCMQLSIVRERLFSVAKPKPEPAIADVPSPRPAEGGGGTAGSGEAAADEDAAVRKEMSCDRIEQFLSRLDDVRGPMWSLGFRASLNGPLLGHGAGTWARFHREQPRQGTLYFAHMHNTYLDLMFEYGFIPVLLAMALCAAALVRLVIFPKLINRLWIFYLAGMATMALGQHLFYAFTSMCLLLPMLVLLIRGLRRRVRSGARECSGESPA